MFVRWFHAVVTVAAIAAPISAQTLQRQAVMRGGGGDRGKCTIEVVVDGVAEVEIRGDNAVLRNVSGQPAQWRRFECSGVMPPNPADFRFAGVDGRGRQQLVRDPRNGGPAVIRIEDSQGGSEGYTFDITWNGSAGHAGNPGNDRRDDRRRYSVDDAVRGCQEAVRQQAVSRFRGSTLEFRKTGIDDNPGRQDWVMGTLDVRRGRDRVETYRFSCSVDFSNGRVRSAQIDAMDGGRGDAGSTAQALQTCQRAVEERLRNDGFGRIEFGSINVDNRPGRNDSIVGNARAEGRGRSDSFDFSCQVNLDNGAVRSVDVRRR